MTVAQTLNHVKNRLSQTRLLPPTWLKFFIIVLLVLGIFFRVVNLDRKVYWGDETLTSLRIAGYTKAELTQELFDGHLIGVEDLQKFQQPNQEKGVSGTINSIVVDTPQHPPLYFLMARFWVQWFGSSPGTVRSLSAFISLLVFPCIYWLCRELFGSSLVGWVVIALIAVSPFQVLYAQEARPYSLWSVAILLSSVALLRAMRLGNRDTKTLISTWGVYAATLTLGMYTQLFFVLVAIGHGIYLLTIEKFRFSKTVFAYLLASLVGFLTFVPWVLVILSNLSTVENTTGWSRQKESLFSWVKAWTRNITRTFLDADPEGGAIAFGFDNQWTELIRLTLVGLIVFLTGYSVYFLCRKTSKRAWLFVLTLIGVSCLPFILKDLISGGGLSGSTRHLVPLFLGIEIAVAYLLASKISWVSMSARTQKLWQIVLIAVVSSGVISCAISFQQEVWWNKTLSQTKYNPQIARILNQATQPLLVSDELLTMILPLSHALNPEVRLQLVVKPDVPQIPDGFRDVFLYRSSQKLKNALKTQNYTIEPAYQSGEVWLWKLEKKA
ncbi:glycosyltransferase family 39 protein [Coleofasciculus sp. FACHB-1120]|uniref:glycosyltransferase family 39 protein n=1 Tax=Coleofasciculus sp. FACHB-1120 TaxID=2692783 RepID=UPI001686A245|nr:glycosyltransferase family 39 protein [Coleofasciculus sp. FACHB-1120]MBD2740754.1 glycosyltransferase family 39 protein [Coleofasciculus sp. FACHB-1120]